MASGFQDRGQPPPVTYGCTQGDIAAPRWPETSTMACGTIMSQPLLVLATRWTPPSSTTICSQGPFPRSRIQTLYKQIGLWVVEWVIQEGSLQSCVCIHWIPWRSVYSHFRLVAETCTVGISAEGVWLYLLHYLIFDAFWFVLKGFFVDSLTVVHTLLRREDEGHGRKGDNLDSF